MSADQAAQVQRLKSYFPFRICWGAVHPATGDFKCGANVTKRQVNDLMRQGYEAWTA